MSMESGRVRLEKLNNMEVGSQFGEIALPPLDAMEIDHTGVKDPDCIDYTVCMHGAGERLHSMYVCVRGW